AEDQRPGERESRSLHPIPSLRQSDGETQWGFIDNKGRVVIEPKFASASSFQNGFAIVDLDGARGYLRTDGAFYAMPEYDELRPFSEGRAWVGVSTTSNLDVP